MSKKGKIISYSLVTIICWASAFPLSKYVLLHGLSTQSLSIARLVIGGILLAGIIAYKKMPLPVGRDWIYLFFAALSGNFVYQLLFNAGLPTIPSATATIIIAMTPLTAAFFASFIFREKLSLIRWLCIGVAFIGVAIVLFWSGIFDIHIGALWVFSSMLLFSIYNLICRHLSIKGYSPLLVSAWGMILSALLCIPFLPSLYNEWIVQSVTDMGIIVYLGAFSSAIAFVTWSYALDMADQTADVTSFMFLSPILVTFMSNWLLDEVPNMGFFLGGALILTSLYVFNVKK